MVDVKRLFVPPPPYNKKHQNIQLVTVSLLTQTFFWLVTQSFLQNVCHSNLKRQFGNSHVTNLALSVTQSYKP